jgi:hypothetical protein
MREISIFNQLLPYDLVLLVGFIWFYNKYKRSSFLLLITTLFFAGLFKDIGDHFLFNLLLGTSKSYSLGTIIFEFCVFLWAIKLYIRYNTSTIRAKNKFLVNVFIAYCIWLTVTSLLINEDSFLRFVREISQEIIPFLLFFVFAIEMQETSNRERLKLLFYRLIIAQILFSIAKGIILMDYYEGMVGSLTGLSDGGPGTSLPLLGLLFVALNSNMNLRGKDLWMIIGLLLTGFLAGKRAVWLLFPVLFLLLSIYVYRHQFMRKIIVAAIFVPIFIYIGLRAIPSLNPDNAIWGSFNPGYAWTYGMKYSTGKTDATDEIQDGEGRVGALVLSVDILIGNFVSTGKKMYGYGLDYFYNYGNNYYNSNYWWGINGRGSITGILYKYFSIGLTGAVLFVLYLLALLSNVKNKRMRNVIILLVLFDFVFYSATIISHISLFALIFFVMFYDSTKPIKTDYLTSQ